MTEQEKSNGSKGCQFLAPSATLVRVLEEASYCLVPRIDGTKIMSVTWVVDNKPVVVTVKSWINLPLIPGVDYITFDYPVVSITFAATTDSAIVYKNPL